MASGGREIIEDISRVSCSLNYFISSLRVSLYLNIAVRKEGSIVDFRKEMFGRNVSFLADVKDGKSVKLRWMQEDQI